MPNDPYAGGRMPALHDARVQGYSPQVGRTVREGCAAGYDGRSR
jgi:hypothetical protein